MKNTLKRHRCWLVQSGTFKDDIQEITGKDSILDLNYMGSFEFQCELPQSNQRMLTNIDFYDVFTFPQYTNTLGETLMVYAPKMFIGHISRIVEDLAIGNNHHLKERCTLHKYLKGEKNYDSANFWWDIENDFFIFFGEQKRDLVLAAQQDMRERTVDKVEVGDWDKLSEYYSLVNQDLNDEAKEFLRPKKSKLAKHLIKVLNNKIEQDKNHTN